MRSRDARIPVRQKTFDLGSDCVVFIMDLFSRGDPWFPKWVIRRVSVYVGLDEKSLLKSLLAYNAGDWEYFR